MRTGNNGVRATLTAGWTLSLALTVHLWAQAPAPAIGEAARNPFAGDPAAVTQGAVLFRQECMFCHGAGARGGMRGPDLTTGSWSHGGSDAEIARTISDGVPGTAACALRSRARYARGQPGGRSAREVAPAGQPG